MAWLILAFLCTLVVAHRVPLLTQDTGSTSSVLNQRTSVKLPGGYSTCFLINMDVQGTTFSVMIDSGSTDLTVPLTGLNNYVGPTINTPRPPGSGDLIGTYGDQSGWTGYGFQGTARVTGTNITASNAPVIGMFRQTTNPIYTTGDVTQGLLGIAYPSLASYRVTPSTVVDAWVASGTMPKNEIAFHACPYSMTNQSYVDFGNDDPSYKCSSNGVPVVWAYSPARTYFTIDVRAISIDSVPVTLPQTFQNGIGYNKWSLVDSCTSVMILPGSVITALVNAIQSSGGLPSDLASSPHLSNFLSGSIGIRPVQPFQWSKLPSISFDITSDQIRPGGQNATFKITLGARQYIQPNANGYFAMIARSGGERYANLGIPLFSNLNVVLDRANARVGFSQGCGCDTATDGYPIIQDANGRVWKAGVSTSSTSSASSTPAAATQTTSRRVSQTSTTSSTRASTQPPRSDSTSHATTKSGLTSHTTTKTHSASHTTTKTYSVSHTTTKTYSTSHVSATHRSSTTHHRTLIHTTPSSCHVSTVYHTQTVYHIPTIYHTAHSTSLYASMCDSHPTTKPAPVFSTLYFPTGHCTIRVEQSDIPIPTSCSTGLNKSPISTGTYTPHSTSTPHQVTQENSNIIRRGVPNTAIQTRRSLAEFTIHVCLAVLVAAYMFI
ncbi:hypothetical protein BDEG_21053 [Batrachochytrium dendrobatidis JEL423]|uniref:Peptidase A1 domain-containing protein n=1 Tax=Batrachochytrium dendrobatidis (strain JEL423) TaxID=403673 RepID=A0A177WA30_BATDL|nr:hypothetical protein BDEG_21053 [Batrachochytrium dendrobatidis JEL423]